MRFDSEYDMHVHIRNMGGVTYRVGGQVRDQLLKRETKDRDYVVTGLNPSDMVGFDKIVGSEFPVFLVECGLFGKVEVALARTEKKIAVGHKGFSFNADSSVTIEQDLGRRDLTINAIAERICSYELIDPFDGQVDIELKRLVVVNPDSFVEDPLRAYRVARFAATLTGFEVPEETRDLMSTMKESLVHLSAERVYGELKRAMMGHHPSHFFQTLRWSGLLDVHFPEVLDLNVPDMHDGTSLRHVLRLIDRAPRDLEVRMGLLAHDFGKGRTPHHEHPRHFGHDTLGLTPVNKLCTRLRIPSDISRVMVKSALEHMKIKTILEMKPGTLVRWLWENMNIAGLLVWISELDSTERLLANRTQQKDLFDKIRARLCLAQQAIDSVDGNLLILEGILPDRNFGDKLHERRVSTFKMLEGEIKNGCS